MSLGGLTTGKGCTVLVMAKTVVLFTEHEQLITQLTAQRRAEINISTLVQISSYISSMYYSDKLRVCFLPFLSTTSANLACRTILRNNKAFVQSNSLLELRKLAQDDED